MAEKLGVNVEGLDDLEEIKERLLMEVEKWQPDFVNFKTKVSKLHLNERHSKLFAHLQ